MKTLSVIATCLLVLLTACNKTEASPTKKGPFDKTFHYIKDANADAAELKGNVKSIDYYNWQEGLGATEILEGQTLHLQKTTTYTSDKKKLSVKVDNLSEEHFYYDKDGKLYLWLFTTVYNTEESQRFWYDEYGNPLKVLKYRKLPNDSTLLFDNNEYTTLTDNPTLAFDGYEKMNYVYGADKTTLELVTVSSEMVTQPVKGFDKAEFDSQSRALQMDEYTHIYNEKGLLTEKVNSDKTRSVKYTYNEAGNLVSREEVDMSGDTTLRMTTTFDASGNIVSIMNGKGEGYEFEYKFDKAGNWTEKKSYFIYPERERSLADLELRKITYYGQGESNTGVDESRLQVSAEVQQMLDRIEETLATNNKN